MQHSKSDPSDRTSKDNILVFPAQARSGCRERGILPFSIDVISLNLPRQLPKIKHVNK